MAETCADYKDGKIPLFVVLLKRRHVFRLDGATDRKLYTIRLWRKYIHNLKINCTYKLATLVAVS